MTPGRLNEMVADLERTVTAEGLPLLARTQAWPSGPGRLPAHGLWWFRQTPVVVVRWGVSSLS